MVAQTPHRRLLAVGLLALLLCAAASSASAKPGGPSPRTLAVLTGDVAAFDADAGRLGWITPRAPCNRRVHVLVLASRRARTIDKRSCRYDRFHDQTSGFVLVGRRAVWNRWGAGNLELDGYVLTAAVDDRTTRVITSFSDDDRANSGAEPDSLVSDGGTALIGTGGAVLRLAGRRAITLFALTRGGPYGRPTVGDSLIAVPTRRIEDADGGPIPGSIEIHSRRDGALLRVLPLEFAPEAVSNSQIAATGSTADGNAVTVTTYDVQSGNAIWVRTFQTLVGMDFSGGQLVIATEKRIVMLNANDGQETVLARVTGFITGLDIDGRRILWLEQVGNKRFRVRSLPGPA